MSFMEYDSPIMTGVNKIVDGSCFCVLLTGCWKFIFSLFHGKDIDSLYA